MQRNPTHEVPLPNALSERRGGLGRTAERGGAGIRGVVPQVNDKNDRGYSGSRVLMAKGMSLAFEFAGAVFLFWFLGKLVDDWLGIEPWGQVVGAIIGWIGGILHVYYATQRGGRDTK